MSRERSSSSASTTSGHALIIKIYRLSRPGLSIAHDHAQPELPPLPHPELVLPKAAQQAYVGEEFQCLLVVQRNPAHPPVEGPLALRVETEAPEGARTQLLAKDLESDAGAAGDGPAGPDGARALLVERVGFALTGAGAWTLRASVRIHEGGEERLLRRAFRVNAAPAISVRTKVSKGSTALKAHVLEAQVENLSEGTLVIESCAVNAENGWEATAPAGVTGVESEESAGGGIVLRPHDVSQFCFMLRGGWAPEAGPLAVGWRREPLGAKGWQTTGSIRI